MTLRLRLVLALVALVTVGLAVFIFTMYNLYARSQYDRLDDQLRSSVALVSAQLRQTAGIEPDDQGPHGDDHHGQPPIVVPPGTYAELYDASGTSLATIQVADGSSVPAIPSPLPPSGSIVTTESESGSGEWRVLVSSAASSGGTLVVAVPTTEVTDALHRLALIGVASSAVLLVLLAGGAWLIVRHDLRPVEQMAATARTITAGALDQRVAADEPGTEVGELGHAINTMLAELERAFRERDATEQRLRQFLADASHELRTPLTSIQGFAELFRVTADDQRAADLPVIMRRIEEESARMKTLVDDLLLLARLDQPREMERVDVDLVVLAADACSDAAAVAPDRSITLDAPGPAMVSGDRDHLRQAIGNLVANALRHTPAAAPIEVTVRSDGDDVTLSVRDHGAGLDDAALVHVFDRFWQADAARAGSGAGLGLAIVAGIASEHGGTADAKNAPDGGAIFTLTLPRSERLGVLPR
jgi:two-component system OmpR family sensor kinase